MSFGFTPALFAIRAAALTIGSPLLRLWRKRLKGRPTQKFETLPEMEPLPQEGYTDKAFYKTGEMVTFYLKAETEKNSLKIQQILKPYQYEIIEEISFNAITQTENSTTSEQGCNWKPTLHWQ